MKNPIVIALVSFAIFIASIFLGTEIATENYLNLVVTGLIISVLLYAVYFYKSAFLFIWVLSLSGLSMNLPIGNIRGLHIAVALFVVTALYEFILSPKQALRIKTWKSMLLFYLVSCCVFSFLYLYQIVNPISPHEFSAKQTLKALIESLAPFLLMLVWCLKSDANVFRFGSTKRLLTTLGALLFFHICFRLYLLFIGALDSEADVESTSAAYNTFGFFSVSPYVLRALGPLGALVGIFSFFHWRVQPIEAKGRRVIQWGALALTGMGVLGAILSSGRGALIVAILGLLGAFFYYRKFILLLMLGSGLVLFVVALNLFSSVIQGVLPDSVARALTIFIVNDEDSKASLSVESSSSWRAELAEMAYDEWVSDDDLFIRGRGVYTYTEFDALSVQIYGGYEAMMITSLKTANTHTTWLSLGLRFGLIGLIFSYLLHIYILSKGGGLLLKKINRKDVSPLFVSALFMIGISLPLSLISSANLEFSMLLLLLGATRSSIEEGGSLE